MPTRGRRLTATLAALLLASCATTPVASSSSVRPASADAVAGCEYLDDLVGASGWYGVAASRGAENARADLLRKAESLGATHVVWADASSQYGGTSVEAKAYRCP